MQTGKVNVAVLDVSSVMFNPANPRIINLKSESFLELANSVKANGVIIPVHVRPYPKQKGKYELLAGERRVRAARYANLAQVKAIVHENLSDADAFEITFAENFAREDLTPLEEGKAVQTLLEKYKGDVKAVASKMGKCISWVTQRARINKYLIQKWHKTITDADDGDDITHITAAHLQLIAAMPENIQAQLFEKYSYNLPTVGELTETIDELIRFLKSAPWDKGDTTLVSGLCACEKCLKRSSSQPGLFDDTTDEEQIKKNDRCLDYTCWHKKEIAYLVRKAQELKKRYPNLVFTIPTSQYNIPQAIRESLHFYFENVFSDFKDSKEGAKGSIPALMIYGADVGKMKWIKLNQRRNTEEKESRTKGQPTPLAERRKMLESKRWFKVLRFIIKNVEQSAVADINEKKDSDKLIAVVTLAATFGTNLIADTTGYINPNWKLYENSLKSNVSNMQFACIQLWTKVRPVIVSRLTYNGPITQVPQDYIDEAKRVVKLLNIDIKHLFKEATKETPEPKTWASLNADGTPKTNTKIEVKKKAAAGDTKKATCKQCKSAHPFCKKCCLTCKDECNSKQRCSLKPKKK